MQLLRMRRVGPLRRAQVRRPLEGDAGPVRRPAELADASAEIKAAGLFGEVTARLYDWEISYTADEYIRLLDTFSGHIAMAGWQRDRLYGEIRRRLAERPDGRLRRHWGAVLNVARRLDEAAPVT
jgi:hypothetical protein